MPQTPLSGTSSYVTPQDVLNRYDARTVGELLVDDDTQPRLTVAQILLDSKMLALCQDASGELESALVAGNRQDPLDLAAIMATPCNAQQYVNRLLASLVMGYLLERRPDRFPMPESVKTTREFIELLRQGQRILPTVEAALAGVHVPPIQLPILNFPLVTDEAFRYFGFMWRPQLGGRGFQRISQRD
jgi:hypothetical protein